MKAVLRQATNANSRTLVVYFNTRQEKQRFIHFAHHAAQNTVNRAARNLRSPKLTGKYRLDPDEEVSFARWLLTKAKDASLDERRWARSILRKSSVG